MQVGNGYEAQREMVRLRSMGQESRWGGDGPAVRGWGLVNCRPRSLNTLIRLVAVNFFASVMLSALAQTPANGRVDNFDTVIIQAAAARDQHDVPAAIQLYTQAVDMKPGWAEGWWSLGTIEYATDQYAPAREALTHFIALTPNAGPALALRGLCEFELGQYPQSLDDLQHGIILGAASQPKNAPIVLYHEALLLTRLGSFDEAVGKYSYFVKHAAPSAELATAVGLAGLRMPLLPGDVDAAQAPLVAAVGQAALPMMNGDLPAGEQAFQDVYKAYPRTPNIHYFEGYLLYAAHSDDATAQFEDEIGVSPHNAMAHAMLAWSAGYVGDYVTALPAAKQAVAEDPSLQLGQLMYGRSLIETGDINAGLPLIQKVLQQDPQSLEAHLTLAKAYSELGRKEDAQQERQLCLKMADQGAASSATP